jgi:glycosyltransferase involved in cell wall biosynthesis
MLRRLKNLAWRLQRRARRYKQIMFQSNHLPDHGISIDTVELPLPETLPGGYPWPKISVITPSFNQGRYISETIESVLKQDYPNIEHIIIDGGSTDETMQVIEHYRSQLAHVVSEPDHGQSDALNKGFRLATGNILCWLNSDDQFAPEALKSVAMAFATHEVDLVSGICEIYKDDKLVNRHMSACADGPLPLDELLDLENGWNAGQFFYQPEVFFSRAIWEKAGAHVREDCYYSMDYELWCRFAHVGAKLHVIGASLAHFRVHSEQKTADPEKFKKELIGVRDRFAATHSIKLQPSARPSVKFERVLRVAMVNDQGMRHGAGIAHGRLAAGLDMAGHEVKLFDLGSLMKSDGTPDEAKLVSNVIRFNPDVVVFGNLHTATRDSVTVVDELSSRFPSFWVTHDFWLFTGRCAYTGNCRKYLSDGCDQSCPTANHYPNLSPRKISDAWKRKQSLLSSPHAPFILANSTWSQIVAHEALASVRGDAGSRIRHIKLGAPTQLFKPLQKMAARNALGINTDQFVIAFSVSSLGEERKGGHYLIEALQNLDLPNISVLLIGNQDVPFDASGIELVCLGYVNDATTLTAALSAADIYVGPSTEETFGQVFIEAALAGTPSIGFDQTGVRDAIVDGITGLRISASAEALREAIIRLYSNRDICKHLGSWGRIYALNEFSLESAYHSLFVTWREAGLIDSCGVPHKIGFTNFSAFIGDRLRPITSWHSVHGISAIEGPWPQLGLPTTFQWCYGQQSRIVVNCPEEGLYQIRLVYLNNLFRSLEIKLTVNGEPLNSIVIKRTSRGKPAFVDFQITGLAGENFIDFFPSKIKEPTKDDPRALTFILKDISLQKIANLPKTH